MTQDTQVIVDTTTAFASCVTVSKDYGALDAAYTTAENAIDLARKAGRKVRMVEVIVRVAPE